MSIGGTAQKRHVSWRDEDSPLSSARAEHRTADAPRGLRRECPLSGGGIYATLSSAVRNPMEPNELPVR
jgi:hypothetical protein